MNLSRNSQELRRLINAFETEASKFRDLRLSTYFIQAGTGVPARPIDPENYLIILWQYYGSIEGDAETEELIANIEKSDFKWGVTGSELTSVALLEGEQYRCSGRSPASRWATLPLAATRFTSGSLSALCAR